MNTLPLLLGGKLNKDAVLADVARWRRAHGLGPKRPGFHNSPQMDQKAIAQMNQKIIDVVSKVEVIK